MQLPLDAIMEAVRACKYLAKQKYAAMLLRDYGVSVLLDSIRRARERKEAKWKAEKKRLRSWKAAETRLKNTVN